MAEFFLRVGQVLAGLACAGSVVGALLAIGLSRAGRDTVYMVIVLYMLGAMAGVCFWGAMVVVFTEVLRLREERAQATRSPAPSPLQQNEQPGSVRE
jgi:hypothetical protein